MPTPQKESVYARRPNSIIWAACLTAILCSVAAGLMAAEPPSEDLLQLIADLVADSDKQMRAIGLQQIRDEAPGEAATKRFVELLPKLDPAARGELVEALGERGDATARVPGLPGYRV